MTHDHDHRHHGHDPGHTDDARMATIFDLDAAVTGSYLDGAIDRVEAALGRTPDTVVDLGAGTGTGTQRLAARFPRAQIVAVDHSPTMAARVAERARTGEWSDRLRTVSADFGHGWPTQIRQPDVVWASSSLHHVPRPDDFLRGLRAAIRPDGVLAVLEISMAPRFLPDDPGLGRPGWEQRCADILSAMGWNTYPDWAIPLRANGFDVTHTTIEVSPHVAGPHSAEYAQAWYTQTRPMLADALDADDRATLDALLSASHPLCLRRRTDLRVRSGRHLWLARPAAAETTRSTPGGEDS